MYPILLDPAFLRPALVGAGRAALRRYDGLMAGGHHAPAVFCPVAEDPLIARAGPDTVPRLPTAEDLAGRNLLLVAGLSDARSEAMARLGRTLGILVNVEDRTQWCDFHLPAVLRRGDVLLTASTAGRCPGLARSLRARLADSFGPEWAERLDEIAEQRLRWKAAGDDQATLSRKTQEWIDRARWFG